MSLLAQIGAEKLWGLHPQAWVCVGGGLSREDLKDALLSPKNGGRGFFGSSVVRVQDICLRVLAGAGHTISPDSLLSNSARQEILRILIADRKILVHLPEIKKLRRQTSFLKKLDRSIQSGRMAFAHDQEESVYYERLGKLRPVQDEVRLLARAYESWLKTYQVWDAPALLREAASVLKSQDSFQLPAEIFYLHGVHVESLEASFLDALAEHTSVIRISDLNEKLEIRSCAYQRWHTADDAADFLGQKLASIPKENWAEHIVLVPDQPEIRRTLMRGLRQWGVPVADPRDPTQMRWDESVKAALLPMEVVAGRFERGAVISWLQQTGSSDAIGEINSRGVTQGLPSYAGGVLSPIYDKLKRLQARFQGKKTALEIGKAHLEYLIQSQMESRTVQIFERLWENLVGDFEKIGQSSRKAPVLFWLEALMIRIRDSGPALEKLRPQHGVKIHRLGQAPVDGISQIWIFNPASNWLEDQVGDYWFSERDREILASEFAVRSAPQLKQERIASIQAWAKQADQVHVLDSAYGWNGKERESLMPLLAELGLQPDEGSKEMAHARWVRSFGAIRPIPPQTVRLAPVSVSGKPTIAATALDHASTCQFRALSSSRWKLYDLREPGMNVWPEVRGNILHRAVKILTESRGGGSKIQRSAREALEEAWLLERPKGLFRGERHAAYVKSKMVAVLERFIEQEQEYIERSGTQVLHQEGPLLRLEFEDFDVTGIPDRVDEHEKGIFVMDYKSGTQKVSGTKMVEEGYRLQLPFYAVALEKQLGKPVVGVQFVELTPKGSRIRGIFFKPFNGKEPGKLTNTRSKTSVLELEPESVWAQATAQIRVTARRYLDGIYDPVPKDPETDCGSCRYSDLCGRSRMVNEVERA